MIFLKRFFTLVSGRNEDGRAVSTGIFQAARDMTEYDRIRELVHWADEALERGEVAELTLDLSHLVRMDTSFLAGIVLVCRRARAHSIPVHIKRFPKHFETLVDLYRVRGALREAGVIFEDPISEEEAAKLSHAGEGGSH